MRRSHPEVAADRYSTVKDFIYFDKGGSWVHQVATEPEAARISDGRLQMVPRREACAATDRCHLLTSPSRVMAATAIT
jgi:hypothetical protein